MDKVGRIDQRVTKVHSCSTCCATQVGQIHASGCLGTVYSRASRRSGGGSTYHYVGDLAAVISETHGSTNGGGHGGEKQTEQDVLRGGGEKNNTSRLFFRELSPSVRTNTLT